MGPTVTVRGNQVTSMSSVCIIKVIIGLFNNVSQTNAQTNPTNEFLYSYSPTLLSLSKLRKTWFNHRKSLTTALHVGLFSNGSCYFDFMTFELLAPVKDWSFGNYVLIERLKNFLNIFVNF